MTSTLPSWVAINSTTGVLSIVAPDVSSDTEYDFYIVSSVSGVTSSILKKIKLTVLNWSVSNWQKCSSTSISIWDTCYSGYVLSSGGVWINSSYTAKALSTTTISVVTATSVCIVFASFLNSSSIASLWLIINQLQTFFLLLLTNSYIPADIQKMITGSDFSLNIFEYIPMKKLNIYPNFLKNFEFELANPTLESFEINYGSTINNTYSFFTWLLIVIILHIFIPLFIYLLSKWTERNNRCFKVINWSLKRSFYFFTFGYYIKHKINIEFIK